MRGGGGGLYVNTVAFKYSLLKRRTGPWRVQGTLPDENLDSGFGFNQGLLCFPEGSVGSLSEL